MRKMLLTTLRCGTALAVPLMMVPAAHAQDAQVAAETADPATESAVVDDDSSGDIVVTAQKRDERLQEVPISVSVLTGRELDAQAIGGVSDALREVAGVSLSSTAQGGATQITMRGVAANGPTLSGSSPVAYYIDAVPFALVKSAILPDTNAYDMARIEVLRGPQGTLYGANALNGVVRLLTNDADLDEFDVKARVGASTTKGGDESFRGDVAVNVPLIPGKLAVRVVAGAENLGGWIEQPAQGLENANDARSRNLRVKLNAQPTDRLSIGLSAWISRVDLDAPNYADDDGIQTTPVPIPQRMDYDAYSAKIGYELPGVSISSATSYLKFANTGLRDYNFLGPNQTLFTDIRSEIFTEELLLNSTGDSSWRWSVGGFYRDATDLLYQELFVLPAPINTSDKSKSFAVFGQLTKAFFDDRLELTGGLRYFRDKVTQIERTSQSGDPTQPLVRRTDTFEAVTPRVVLTWLPNRDFTAYASYSQGFRSGFNQNPSVIRTAPDLPPVDADRLHNYEVGAKGNLLNGGLTFDAAVYYIDWKDIQQNVTLRYLGASLAAAINGSSASGLGVDLSVVAHPFEGFNIGGTFSWNDLTLDEEVISNNVILFDKGDRLAFSPKYTASAFANYNFPLSDSLDGQLAGSINYRSKIPGRLLSGGVSRLFLSDDPLIAQASFAIKSDKWTATFFIENITNWNGILQPPTDVSLNFRQRPRTFGLQFEWHL